MGRPMKDQTRSGGSKDRAAIEKLFERSHTELAKLDTLRTRMSAAAVRSGEMLSELSSLSMTTELIDIEQAPLARGLEKYKGVVRVVYQVHAWRSLIVVCISPNFLFRIIDAMFGGDGSARPPEGPRALKQIESRIALRAAAAVVDALREVLADVAPISAIADRADWGDDLEPLENADDEALMIGLRVTEFGDQILATLPVRMLEDARGKLQTEDVEEELAPDPKWRRTFETNVLDSNVELVADAPGPAMKLGDVAALKVGSLVELDADALYRVCMRCETEAIFEGRLGQSNGYFTICLESPAQAGRRETSSRR